MKERECNKYTLYLGRSGGGAASIPSRDKGRKEYTKKNERNTHTHFRTKSLSFSFGSFFSPTSLESKGPPPPSFVCVLLCGHTNKKEKKKEKL